MPARNSSVPKLRQHKASGQAAVVLNGHWRYLGKFGTAEAQREYNLLIATWHGNGRSLHAEAELTVSELILQYWRYASARYVEQTGRPKKELSAIKTAMRPVKRLFGAASVAEFGPRALLVIQQEYVRAGYCRTIVNDQVRRVRRMFKWATANELIDPSVFHGLQAVDGLRAGESSAPEPRDVKPVPQEYIDAILPYVSRQVRTMIRLQLLCGARPAEIAMVRAADIDMTGVVWEYRPPRHKTMKFGKSRLIFLGPKAQVIVREFLKPDTGAYLFSPIDADRERRELLQMARKTEPTPSRRRRRVQSKKAEPRRQPGQHYTTNSFRQAIWRACDTADAKARGGGPPFICKQCGRVYRSVGFLKRHTAKQHGESVTGQLDGERTIPRWSPNQLRHNFATRMRKEFGIEVARVLLGHSSLSTTEVYSERDAVLAASVIHRVG